MPRRRRSDLTFDTALLNKSLLQQPPLKPEDSRYDIRVGEHFMSPDGRLQYSSKFKTSPINPEQRMSQGTLFHPSEFRKDDEARREEAVGSHEVWQGKGETGAETDVFNALRNSLMPTGMIKALRGVTSVKEKLGIRGIGAGGYYNPNNALTMGSDTGRIVLKRQQKGDSDSGSSINGGNFIHELGHRADYRSLNAELPRRGDKDPYKRRLLLSRNREGSGPNPVSEGHADGFADRYFNGQKFSGYEKYKGWGDYDRATYVAARAHFAATGENTRDSSSDEFFHRMLNTSPHAVKALQNYTGTDQRQNLIDQISTIMGESVPNRGLEAAQKAAERYKFTRKVGTQLSLLGPEYEHDVFDIPESHKPADGVQMPTIEPAAAPKRKSSLRDRLLATD